jgi:UPF0755 protein
LSRGNRSRSAQQRTAQEREADRLERERRRAEREGTAAPQPGEPDAQPVVSAPPDEPAAAPPPDVAPEAEGPVEAEPDALQPEISSQPEPSPAQPTASEFEPVTEAHPAPVPDEPLLEPPYHEADAPLEQSLASHDVGERAEYDDAGDDSYDDEDEAAEQDLPPWEVRGEERPAPPANLVVGQRMRSSSGPLAGGGGGGLRGRVGRSQGGDGRGGRRVTRARVAALFALLAAAALVWFVISLFQPFAGSGSGRVIVSIPKGSSSSEIGSILARDDVVSSGFFFDVRALLDGKRSSLHSGRFAMEHGMTYSEAIDALSKPPPRAIAVKVVVPEGYTRRQIADLVSEDALTGDYLAQTKRSSLLNPAHYGAPTGTPSLEGFLFPATYDLTAGAPVKRLVDEQLTAFQTRFTSADRRRARALGVTSYQLLTVASMIEREAQTDHDRPLIAAVIYNRLREGIPLGIDASIYYAVELQKGIATYTGELTESQLKIDSPYNTRTHKGLPPTPISNPGEASIDAAAHPAHVHYLYYVAAADGCGKQVFSDTYAQFQKNVAAYQAAVKKNGGRPPTCKKK